MSSRLVPFLVLQPSSTHPTKAYLLHGTSEIIWNHLLDPRGGSLRVFQLR